ncbi:MAG: Rab family GTPase [Promethearchaeota archaeon]
MVNGNKPETPTKRMGYLYKIVLIGDGAVGKTALRNRFMGKGFDPEYLMTIGADFSLYTIRLETVPESPTVTFQIWDLAGTPHHGTILSAYYKGAYGALIVYDVTRRDTYENVRKWADDFIKNNGRGELPFCVIANKTDLRSETPVSIQKEEGLDLTEQLTEKLVKPSICIDYIETSALTGQNVNLAFHSLARNIWVWLEEMRKKR